MRPSILRTFARRAAKLVYFSDLPKNLCRLAGLQGKFTVKKIGVDLGLGGRGLKPLRTAFVSDLHLGRLTHESVIKSAREAIEAARADLLILGGDYLFLDDSGMRGLEKFLRGQDQKTGKFAVLGNHDCWLFRDRLSEKLRECGFDLLVNRPAKLGAPYDFISIYGMDDVRYGTPSLELPPKNKGEKRVFICHSPEGLSFAEGNDFDLGLFGHTHGGQIALRPSRPFLPFKDDYSKRFPRGFYDSGSEGPGFPLYVTNGIGCVWLPVRLFSPSEVVIIDLL